MQLDTFSTLSYWILSTVNTEHRKCNQKHVHQGMRKILDSCFRKFFGVPPNNVLTCMFACFHILIETVLKQCLEVMKRGALLT